MPTCVRCGKCCTVLHLLTVEAEDVARWRREGREDILRRVGETPDPEEEGGTVHEVWLSPRADGGGSGGGDDGHCPWLRRTPDGLAACAIHGTKPARCRDYPAGCEQARRIGCMALP